MPFDQRGAVRRPAADLVRLCGRGRFVHTYIEWYEQGLLDESSVAGSRESNLTKSSKRVPVESRKESFNRAYAELSEEGRPVKIDDMAKKMGVSKQTVRNRYKDVEDEYWLDSNMIGKLIKSA